MLAKRYNVVQMRQFFSSKSCVRLLSLPMRGEWIEIINTSTVPAFDRVSLPMRGEWIEIFCSAHMPICLPPSLPMRGEWIEIFVLLHQEFGLRLSPCGESGLK